MGLELRIAIVSRDSFDFGAATHPGVGGGRHRRRATFELVKCFWEVFVRRFRVLFLSCLCVSVSGVLFSVGVFVCGVTC